MDDPTDPRFQVLIDRIADLEVKIIEIDAKQTRQLKSSNFDFTAYIGVGIGAIALMFLFGLSVNHQNGKTQISYESSQVARIVLGIFSTGSAVWGFNQHHKAKRERDR